MGDRMTEQERLNAEATERTLRLGRQMMAAFDTIFAPTKPKPAQSSGDNVIHLAPYREGK